MAWLALFIGLWLWFTANHLAKGAEDGGEGGGDYRDWLQRNILRDRRYAAGIVLGIAATVILVASGWSPVLFLFLVVGSVGGILRYANGEYDVEGFRAFVVIGIIGAIGLWYQYPYDLVGSRFRQPYDYIMGAGSLPGSAETPGREILK